MTGKILIVEDEKPVREMVGFALARAGFQYREAPDARSARLAVGEDRPDLILLDWMLPDTSGVELARGLKRDPRTRDIPIILLTARGQEEDKITGLGAGADDYVTKPFSPRELIARIQAVLRRAAPHALGERLQADGLELDPAGHRVTAGGRPVGLGPTEFRLLAFFMTHPDRVYTRAQILDLVWGTNVYIEERTVDVHIRRLRKGLAPSGHDRLVQTVRGVGYRFSRKP